MNAARLRPLTKVLVAILTAGWGLFQVPAVHDWLIEQAKDHPHVVSLIGVLTGIATLLHNPQVQQVLGIKQTVTTTTETVEVANPQVNDKGGDQ